MILRHIPALSHSKMEDIMKKILLVIDMQNDFIDGALGTPEAVAIVENVKAKIRSYPKEDVFATRDTHTDFYMDTQEGHNLPVPHCIRADLPRSRHRQAHFLQHTACQAHGDLRAPRR